MWYRGIEYFCFCCGMGDGLGWGWKGLFVGKEERERMKETFLVRSGL